MDAENSDIVTQLPMLGAGRRGLMRKAGLGAAGMAAAGAVGVGGLALSARPAMADITSDNAILNFALNLEYLEANFYLFAALGHGLPSSLTSGIGTTGTVTGGSAVPFKNPIIMQYAYDIASDEQAHVIYLRNTLGAAAVAQPNINLSTSFSQLAVAAGLIVQGQTFNPFVDDVSFLIAAYIFEDVGVTAYLGALSSITTPAYVTAAGGIMAVEGYHAANIRTSLADIGGGQVTNAISNLRATLAQANDDSGTLKPNGYASIAPTDFNGLAFPRTTRQVMNIVYGGVNATSGLFYPNGMNS